MNRLFCNDSGSHRTGSNHPWENELSFPSLLHPNHRRGQNGLEEKIAGARGSLNLVGKCRLEPVGHELAQALLDHGALEGGEALALRGDDSPAQGGVA